MKESPTAQSEQVMEGLFRTWDSHLRSDVIAFGVGAGLAHGPGGDAIAGAAMHLGSGQSQLPHWILVQTDESGLLLFSSDKQGAKGHRLLGASRGTFRASLHRNIGQVQLMVFIPGQPSIALRGKAVLGRRKQIRVARAVVEMAKAS